MVEQVVERPRDVSGGRAQLATKGLVLAAQLALLHHRLHRARHLLGRLNQLVLAAGVLNGRRHHLTTRGRA